MHRLTLFIALLFLVLMLVMCQSNAEKEAKRNFPEHSSVNSLDWNGTYKGTLPCADCPGIQVSLELNSDHTYLLSRKYLDKGNANEVRGKFTWDQDGNRIVLDSDNGWYRVGENRLIHLDRKGNRIEGALADKYVLEKI